MERVNLRRLPDDWTADDEALAQMVDDATATPIYISYRLAPEWFDGIHAALDELEQGIRRRPVVSLTLVEHFLIRLDRASVDDSDGGMIEVGQRLRQILIGCADAAGLMPDEAATLLHELAKLEFWPDES